MLEISQELAREYSSREFIVAQTEVDEHLEFIKEQIRKPFDSGEVNHFRKMMKMITDKNQRQEYSKRVMEIITDEYENLDLDIEDLERDLVPYAEALYKFFGKNVKKMTSTFLREYLYNNRNRKMLLSSYQDIKLSSYPKEQFGKKDNYILIIKLPAIVKDIMGLQVTLDQFIQYCVRNNDEPVYVEQIRDMVNSNILADYGVYADIMQKFRDSDAYDGILNKLQMSMVDSIVRPSIEELGYKNLSTMLELEDDDIDDADDPDEPDDIDDTAMKIDDFEDD